jgi:hypothetical protein
MFIIIWTSADGHDKLLEYNPNKVVGNKRA